jgi:cation/acetate symporter
VSAAGAIYPSQHGSRKPWFARALYLGERRMADEELLQRDAIDGRVAFAIAAFLAAAGLVVLLDRVGVPERVIGVAGPIVVLVGLGLVGVLLRSMRISRYYAAGRQAPPAYAGLATATLAIAIAVPFTPPVGDRFSGAGVFAGFAGGLACAVLISGPYLRKTGAFSVSNLIAARFENQALRLGVACVVAASALLAAVAGFDAAVSGLATIAGLGRPAAAAIIGAALLLIAAPGGQNGVVWATAGSGGVFAAAFGLPLAILAARGQRIALPVFGDQDAWRSAIDRIAAWQGDAGAPATLTLSVGMALGMASCAPLLAPLVSVRDRAAALRAGVGALIWGGALAAIVAATVAASTLGLLESMVGRRPDRLPDAIYSASATRLVAICGVSAPGPAQARAACQQLPDFKGTLRAEDIQTRGAFLVTALPPLASLGAAMSGLVWAAYIAAGLALAASGLLAMSIAFGNDAFYHVRDRAALTSRRLAVTRAILVLSIIGCAGLSGARDLDARTLIGLALTISAAVVAPLMGLALWPRARPLDAMIALVVGLCAAEATLVSGALNVDRLALGSVAGFAAAIAAGVISSLFGGGDRSAGRAFLSGLVRPDRDVLDPDKGA